MKYYIGKYWEMANSTDSDIRQDGIAKWNEAAKKYGPYFQSIRENLPVDFLAEFDRQGWFHDFLITNISIKNIGWQHNDIELHIELDEWAYRILLVDVKGFNFAVADNKSWVFGKLCWGYSEFELIDNDIWIIRILCDFYDELEISFKEIKIETLESTL